MRDKPLWRCQHSPFQVIFTLPYVSGSCDWQEGQELELCKCAATCGCIGYIYIATAHASSYSPCMHVSYDPSATDRPRSDSFSPHCWQALRQQIKPGQLAAIKESGHFVFEDACAARSKHFCYKDTLALLSLHESHQLHRDNPGVRCRCLAAWKSRRNCAIVLPRN